MAVIETAGGAISSSQLGRTLMHEHVFLRTSELHENYPELWGADEPHVDEAVRRLDELKQAGFDSIVDLTVLGLGRYLPRIRTVAERTRVNILVATGVYTYGDVPFCFSARGPGTELGGPEPMTELFVREIRHGVSDTGIKPAILKCATDEPGLRPGVVRVLRAVAQAHRETGVPISTHTHAATRRGLEQQEIFAEEGVDLSRVIIGHSGDTTDLGYLEELIGNGSYVGMDRFGLDMIVNFENRVATVVALCERGHADRVVLSHDASCHTDEATPEQIAEVAPRYHYRHIAEDVLPALRARGVTDEQIDQMVLHEPRDIFERQGGY